MINFVCEGKVISDSDLLDEILTEEATVYVTGGLDGGKKKKKRKPHTTKKKNKHKHRPTKLSTLKYYSVDAAGKISYTRKVISFLLLLSKKKKKFFSQH